MSKSIVIDKESYTCTKKKLKKSLEAKGVSFTLSEVSDILAQSFGFKNEFDMQRNYFDLNRIVNKPTVQKQEIKVTKENIDGYVNINVDIILPQDRFSPTFDELLISQLDDYTKDIKGHILIAGSAGVGKTTMMRMLKSKKRILSFGDINEFEYDPEEDIYSKRQLDLINHAKTPIIFCIHNKRNSKGLEVLKSMSQDFDNRKIQYVININVIKNKS